jgi:aminopeptidase N
MMVWSVLAQMVRDSELRPVEYFKLVLAGLKKEEDDLLLGNLLGRHSTIRDHYFLYLSEDHRKDLAPSFEELLVKRFNSSDKGSSLQMAFFDFYVSIAQTKNAQDFLYAMLIKNSPPKGIVLDQDRRWTIISTLATNGHVESAKLSQEEAKKDSSTLGMRKAFAVKSALPDLNAKKEIWKEMLTKNLTYSNFREAAAKFHGPNQSKLSSNFVDEFFKKVTSIDWKSNDSVVDIYFENLFPIKLCSKDVLSKSELGLKTAKNLTSIARRSWLEAQDELSRCVKVLSKN